MSELKSFTFGLGNYMEDGSPCVVAFDDDKNPRLASDEKFYIKSEADAVINDLIEKNKRLANKDLIMASETIKDVFKEYNHQKYKRCLAMKNWCEERSCYLNGLENYQMTDKEYQQAISAYWDRWALRWFKLAKKFNGVK